MKKIKVFTLFILVAVFLAVPAISKAVQMPVLVNVAAGTVLTADTLPVIPENPESAILPQNRVYKKRLDSIQRSVSLTYNQYVQDYIDIYLSRKKQVGQWLGLSNYYFPVYEKALKSFNVPDELKFLSIVESSFDPHAVSRSGAIGLWQFMYTTALGYNLKMDNYTDERKDPVASSNAAAHYFRNAFDKFGDWLLVIAAYNCGEGAVERAIVKAGGVKDFWAIRQFLPEQTRNYVPAYIAVTYMMNCAEQHDIGLVTADLPEAIDVIQVNRVVSFESISKAIGVDEKKLTILNPSYKKKIINGTPESPKSLIIPAQSREIYEGLYNALNPLKDEMQIIQVSERYVSKPVVKAKATLHKVKSGENLSIIAERYHVEVQDLKVWNKLKTFTVKPGQILKVSSGKSA